MEVPKERKSRAAGCGRAPQPWLLLALLHFQSDCGGLTQVLVIGFSSGTATL